jgi:hypothetical protein
MLTCAASVSRPFHCGKDRTYVTAMKSDLRNLVSAQEVFIEEYKRYASNSELYSGGPNGLGYRTSTGVTVAIETADAHGWRARATHTQVKGTCTIFVGVVSGKTVGYEGEPRCEVAQKRRQPTPTEVLFNLSVDFWLFAFSVSRRQKKQRAEQVLSSAPGSDSGRGTELAEGVARGEHVGIELQSAPIRGDRLVPSSGARERLAEAVVHVG